MSTHCSRTMVRVMKNLEDCFKQLSFYSCQFIAKSEIYRDEYIAEFNRLRGKDDKDRKRRDRIKHKDEKQKLMYEINKEKKKHRHHQEETDRRKQRHQTRDRRIALKQDEEHRKKEKEREEEKDRLKDRERRRQEQKLRERSKQINKERQLQKQKQKQEKGKKIRPISQFEQQRELDLKKDVPQKGNEIFFQDQNCGLSQNKKSEQKPNKVKAEIAWSKRTIDKIGSNDPKKYKIMRIDQPSSDFQDENASLKVPEIKPRQPLTPYFLFLRKLKWHIANKYPVLDQPGTIKNFWENLSGEQKQAYEDEYRRSLKIYDKKLSQYSAVNLNKSEKQQEIREQNQEVQHEGKRKRTRPVDEYEPQPIRKKKPGLLELHDYQL